MDLVPIILVVTLAMGFNYTNGFHDAANAIATSISTRALTPRVALGMAAVANLVGAFFGAKVAATIGSGIIETADGPRRALAGCRGAGGCHGLEPAHLVVRTALVELARAHRRPRWGGPRRRGRGAVGSHRDESRDSDGGLAPYWASSSATS